jgi:glycosyltransferase involved in cell wall biosynthesis
VNILHVLGDCKLPRDPDHDGASGVVNAVLEIARAQVSLGHNVSVAFAGAESFRSEWQGVQLVGLEIKPWARVRVNGRALDFRRHVPYVSLTRQYQFDVAQGHLYSYLRFLRAKRRIAQFHSDPFYKGRQNEGLDLKPADFANIARNSDAQVAVSQFIAGELERGFAGLGNVHVVHNGVDTARFNPERWQEARSRLRGAWGVQPGEVVFLFVGALVSEKGIIHLARAFTRLASAAPGVHLALAGASGLWGGAPARGGSDEYEDELRRTLRAPLEAGRAHLLGKIPSADMPAVYAASDVVVIPSVCRDAFPLVALEALASARPVIASSTGGIVETVNDHNGILAPPGDEARLEAALRTLAENSTLRERLGDAARQQAKRFSWQAAAQRLDAIYRGDSVRAKRVA